MSPWVLLAPVLLGLVVTVVALARWRQDYTIVRIDEGRYRIRTRYGKGEAYAAVADDCGRCFVLRLRHWGKETRVVTLPTIPALRQAVTEHVERRGREAA